MNYTCIKKHYQEGKTTWRFQGKNDDDNDVEGKVGEKKDENLVSILPI